MAMFICETAPRRRRRPAGGHRPDSSQPPPPDAFPRILLPTVARQPCPRLPRPRPYLHRIPPGNPWDNTRARRVPRREPCQIQGCRRRVGEYQPQAGDSFHLRNSCRRLAAIPGRRGSRRRATVRAGPGRRRSPCPPLGGNGRRQDAAPPHASRPLTSPTPHDENHPSETRQTQSAPRRYHEPARHRRPTHPH